jgi:hypothetical protein
MAKPIMGGPKCPKCSKQPYDIIRWERPEKGPPLKKIIWFCPSQTCNPECIVMDDTEVWNV